MRWGRVNHRVPCVFYDPQKSLSLLPQVYWAIALLYLLYRRKIKTKRNNHVILRGFMTSTIRFAAIFFYSWLDSLADSKSLEKASNSAVVRLHKEMFDLTTPFGRPKELRSRANRFLLSTSLEEEELQRRGRQIK